MNHRQRVQTALAHQQPDRLPLDFGGTFLTSATPDMQRKIADLLGLRGEPDPRFRHFDDRIQKYFGCDLRSITPASGPAWGFDPINGIFPLEHASLAEIEAYPWPEPTDAAITGLEEEAKFLHDETDYFICAAQIGQGIFEAGCYLRGYEQTMYDIGLNPDLVLRLNEIILDLNRRWGDLYFGVIGPYVDMVLIGDDLATQRGPYMSPAAFRRLYKPFFQEYIASIRHWCPQAKIAHHCCGSSFTLLDDLIEIGVEVINPVQTTAVHMSPENLATKKGKLSFLGGVDLQHILPHGTRDEVDGFVHNLIDHLAPSGGYILAACHTLPDDVKPENVIAMLEAAHKWGK
jgi:uroporphyrinogen decarboxylase